MDQYENPRPLGKELAVVIAIAVFVIYVIVGGLAMQKGYFDGTIMRDLFPATILGYLSAFSVTLLISNHFPNAIFAWIISAVVTFAAMTAFDLFIDRYVWSRESHFVSLIAFALLVFFYLARGILRRR